MRGWRERYWIDFYQFRNEHVYKDIIVKHSDPSIQCLVGLVRPQADQGPGKQGRRPSRGRVSMRFVLIAISLINYRGDQYYNYSFTMKCLRDFVPVLPGIDYLNVVFNSQNVITVD